MEVNVVLPAFAVLSIIILIFAKVYSKIRTKFSIKVNCWFCNFNTRVPYNSSNSWYCPSCDQYNGFSADGNYNRPLLELFNEKLNFGSWCTRVKKSFKQKTNGLCNFCNINLELKVQQLAKFVPFNKENYDEEVQQYSDKLERVYRLCSNCQAVLDQTLEKKYKTYVSDQNYSFERTDVPQDQNMQKMRERHSAYLCVSTLVSLGLLLTVIPWTTYFDVQYTLPDYVLLFAEQYLSSEVPTSFLLAAGIVTHTVDCTIMRNVTSFINLLLWMIVLSLTYVPLLEQYMTRILMSASILFFMTSIWECRTQKNKVVATTKPVQLHKLGGEAKTTNKLHKLDAEAKTTKMKINAAKNGGPNVLPQNAELPNKCVSEPRNTSPVSLPPTPPTDYSSEDFGFSRLSVGSGRVTRSQSRSFQNNCFDAKTTSNLFAPRSIKLSPPKLQLERPLEFQPTATRCSSQSSGFVSLSHQKYYDEYRTPSVVGEDLDSISQCGKNNAVVPYTYAPMNPYSLPFPAQFPGFPHTYTIVNFSHPGYNKFYEYSQMPPSAPDLNSLNVSEQNAAEKGWWRVLKSTTTSLLFLFLITSNIAVLWKVFGEDYFHILSSNLNLKALF